MPPQTKLIDAQKALQAGRFDEAANLVDTVLSENETDRDALYTAAVIARYRKDFEAARTFLSRLKSAAPEYGRALQEEGHLAHEMDNPSRALAAYRLATRFNPALIASWRMQSQITADLGDMVSAKQTRAQAERLQALPRELLAVMNDTHEGRIIRAEDRVRAYLRRHPRDVEAIRLLADIGTRLGVHDDADQLLEKAIELEPDNIQLRIDHITVLRKRQKYAAALQQARHLRDQDPGNPVFESLFAIESMQAGNYETALDSFERVLESLPNDPSTLTSQGHALKTYGQTKKAIASYKAAAAASPTMGDSWYALANLKTYKFSDQEIAQMQTLAESADLTFMDRVHFAFALGKAFEDREDYETSFGYYERGNTLKRKQSRYTTEQMKTEFDAQIKYCTEELFQKAAGHGCKKPDPIFILGLPRAGSTLIEQILASHSQVDGTLELPNILSLAHRLRGRNTVTDRDRYPRILHDLGRDELEKLGESYIRDTRIHRSGAPYFTDKMPNNFRHIGLIHLILPNAKIIDARRDPMDCCWSGYKQLFAEGQEFTYGLEEIGSYYRHYVDLMDHWERVLPKGRILRVQHEDVLDDLEDAVRRILDYCDLPFEDQCLNFHETERAVRTASSEQVRRPISRTGQGRWKPFDRFLNPLKDALGPALHQVG